GRPSHDLAEDHARVAPRSHQGGPGQCVDELGAPDLVDHLPVEAIELLAHRAQRERHVVAGVAVGDGEDVEVVDLLAPLLEVGPGRADHAPKALYGGIGHTRGISWTRPPEAVIMPPNRPAGRRKLGRLGDLVGLQAAGADVNASRATAFLDTDLLEI